MSISIYNLL